MPGVSLDKGTIFCEVSINPSASETKWGLVSLCQLPALSVSFQPQTRNTYTLVPHARTQTHIHSHTQLHLHMCTHTQTHTHTDFALPHRETAPHTSGLTSLYVWTGSRKAPPDESCWGFKGCYWETPIKGRSRTGLKAGPQDNYPQSYQCWYNITGG